MTDPNDLPPCARERARARITRRGGDRLMTWEDLRTGAWPDLDETPCFPGLRRCENAWPEWPTGSPPTWEEFLTCEDVMRAERWWLAVRVLGLAGTMSWLLDVADARFAQAPGPILTRGFRAAYRRHVARLRSRAALIAAGGAIDAGPRYTLDDNDAPLRDLDTFDRELGNANTVQHAIIRILKGVYYASARGCHYPNAVAGLWSVVTCFPDGSDELVPSLVLALPRLTRTLADPGTPAPAPPPGELALCEASQREDRPRE